MTDQWDEGLDNLPLFEGIPIDKQLKLVNLIFEDVIETHEEDATTDKKTSPLEIRANLWLTNGKLLCNGLQKSLQSESKIVHISPNNQEPIPESVEYPYPNCHLKILVFLL
jgi:hypothetical protein